MTITLCYTNKQTKVKNMSNYVQCHHHSKTLYLLKLRHACTATLRHKFLLEVLEVRHQVKTTQKNITVILNTTSAAENQPNVFH